MMTDVLLVDGCGRPKIHTISVMLVMPTVIAWEHPQRARNEPIVFVHFDRSNDEKDPDGRQVYRQRGTGLPAIRCYPDYMRKQTIQAPQLRIEAPQPKPHQGNCE